jgi:hypothetical protein
VLHYTRLERLARNNRSSLLFPLVSYEENKVPETRIPSLDPALCLHTTANLRDKCIYN